MERILFLHCRMDDATYDIFTNGGLIEQIVASDQRSASTLEPDKLVDLDGAFIYPGFRDAHCHIFSTAEAMLGFDASWIKNTKQLIEAGREYLAESGRTALYAKRLNDTTFEGASMPTADLLDEISGELPVIVVRVCGHLASVNSVVLDRYPDLKKRYPEGVILENDLDALPSLRDLYGENDFNDALRMTLKTFLSFGVTGVSANDLGRFGRATDKLLLQKILADFPGFSYRSQFSLKLPFNQVEVLSLAAKSGVRPAIKVFRDGSLGGRTAWLREPYSDAPETVGQDTLDDQTHEAVLTTANRLGLQVMTHAIGDEAVSRTLDALEKTSDRDNPFRHAIVHAQITDTGLIERMRDLNVIAIVQPLFTRSDARMAVERLGKRYEQAYAFKAMADAGIKMAFSSDTPVEAYNPLLSIKAAMLGKNGKADSGFSFEDALLHHTKNAAYVDFAEKETGSLEIGFRADFCVFEHNLNKLTPDELAEERCTMTVAGGHLYRHN